MVALSPLLAFKRETRLDDLPGKEDQQSLQHVKRLLRTQNHVLTQILHEFHDHNALARHAMKKSHHENNLEQKGLALTQLSRRRPFWNNDKGKLRGHLPYVNGQEHVGIVSRPIAIGQASVMRARN